MADIDVVIEKEREINVSLSTGGEVNTGNNLGDGEAIYDSKTGTLLNFRTLQPGFNIQFDTNTSGEIRIDAVQEVSAVWGSVGGTLSNQSDLQAALDLKTDSSSFSSHTNDSTIHFTEASIDHNSITNTHNLTSDIDHNLITNTHNLSSDIDHLNIQNIGDYTHTQIDSHINSTSNPHLIGLSNLSDYNTDYINFNTSYSDGSVEGRLQWNSDDGTLEFGLPGESVVLQIGQEQLVRVRNTTGSQIPDGSVVKHAGGSTGNFPNIELARSDTDCCVLGVTTEDIDNNSFGYVTLTGLVRDLDTSHLVEGQSIYLSSTVAGALTSVEPSAPNYVLVIGVCTISDAVNGSIFVHPELFPKLKDLSDVDGTPLTTDGQIMVWNNSSGYFDADKNINDYAISADLNTTSWDEAYSLRVDSWTSPLNFTSNVASIDQASSSVSGYLSLTDWSTFNNKLDQPYWQNNASAGRLWGGVITDATGGKVNISAGAGLTKTQTATLETTPTSLNDGQGSYTELVQWDAITDFTLAGIGYNIIFWDTSAGAFTSALKENFYSVFDFTTDFTIGRVYYDGTVVTERLCGMNRWNFDRRVQMFGEERFPVERALGMMISEVGTRNIRITSGAIWAELVNRFTIFPLADYDSSATDTFTYWYRSAVPGSWINVDSQNTISNLYYDDNSGTLATVSNNRYGVHWVYVVHDSSVHVVYGQGSYTLAQANAVTPPAILPGLVGAYATLVGKIIILKDAAAFTSTQSPFNVQFGAVAVSNHNDLSAIDGGTTDEYYHLTSAQHTVATQAASSTLSGYLTSTDWNTFNNKQDTLIAGTDYEVPLTFSTGLTRTVNTITTNDGEINHNLLLNTHNLTSDIDHNLLTNTHNLTTDIDHNLIFNTHNLSSDIDHNLLTNTHNLTTDINHNTILNTHNLTSDIDHNLLTNTHNLTTDINHNTILNTHNLTSDIDHNLLTNTHNLTTDINHNTILNTHNLTSDIDHNLLTNYAIGEHRTIDDNSTSLTDLWSASKITTELQDKAETTYAMGSIFHNNNTSEARPTGYNIVTWIGVFEPANAENNDIWINTSSG
jgi:hypothetical protein